MIKPQRTGVEQARIRLPALLEDALQGRSTIITRHGKSVAAIVPVEQAAGAGRQRSLVGLAGSGKGLWGRDGARLVGRLREEWKT